MPEKPIAPVNDNLDDWFAVDPATNNFIHYDWLVENFSSLPPQVQDAIRLLAAMDDEHDDAQR